MKDLPDVLLFGYVNVTEYTAAATAQKNDDPDLNASFEATPCRNYSCQLKEPYAKYDNVLITTIGASALTHTAGIADSLVVSSSFISPRKITNWNIRIVTYVMKCMSVDIYICTNALVVCAQLYSDDCRWWLEQCDSSSARFVIGGARSGTLRKLHKHFERVQINSLEKMCRSSKRGYFLCLLLWLQITLARYTVLLMAPKLSIRNF